MKLKSTLDKTDSFLVSELIKNGRVKYTELAKKLKVTPAAVKERVEKLIETKIISPTVLLNTSILFPLKAVIGVEADVDCTNTLIRKLRNCPIVASLTKTSGAHNLIFFVFVNDLDQLESFLNNQVRNEPGIKHVEVNLGNNSASEFYHLRLYELEDHEHVPCGLKRKDRDVCLGCPGLVEDIKHEKRKG